MERMQQLGCVCVRAAGPYVRLGELDRESSLCDRAIEVYETLLNQENHEDHSVVIVGTYAQKASVLANRGEYAESLVLFEQDGEAFRICFDCDFTSGAAWMIARLEKHR